ncbi:ACT domain-containing protein, partial [Staphylococcus aureus]
KEEEILRQLNSKLEVDKAEIEHGLSIIMIVGENMKSHVGVTATATAALSKENVNLAMISQGASEVSVLFVIKTEEKEKALKALYQA